MNDNYLPTPEELGPDFERFCKEIESQEDVFFAKKAANIIGSISDEKFVEILTMAEVMYPEEVANHRNVENLSDALCIAYAISDTDKTKEEFYEEIMKD